jgi:hypothetical protein
MIWDTAFEGTPAGNDFGSVTSVKLRELKSLFKTMLSKEHTFDESETPEMTHLVGYCSIIGRETEQISTNAMAIVEGTLKYNDGSQYLYIGSFNHQDLVNRDLDDAHTQYVLKSDSVFEDVQVDSVSNISNVAYPDTKGDNVVVRKGSHLDDSGDGSPNHVDDCVPASDIQCTLNPDALSIKSNIVTGGSPYKLGAAFRANITGYDWDSDSYEPVSIGYNQIDGGGDIQFFTDGTELQFHDFVE